MRFIFVLLPAQLQIPNDDHKSQLAIRPLTRRWHHALCLGPRDAQATQPAVLLARRTSTGTKTPHRHASHAHAPTPATATTRNLIQHKRAALPAPALAEVEAIGRAFVDAEHAAALGGAVDFEVGFDGGAAVDVGGQGGDGGGGGGGGGGGTGFVAVMGVMVRGEVGVGWGVGVGVGG